MIFKSKTPPLCRYCGGPIRKKTINLWFDHYNRTTPRDEEYWKEFSEKPTTREEAQRLTNYPIVSVRYSGSDDRHIYRATAWDGISYEDPYFCSGGHAKAFGYLYADKGYMTVSYQLERDKQKQEN